MNNFSKVASFLILFSLLVVIAIYDGCKSTPSGPEPLFKVPVDKYLFLEHEVNIDGVNIEGEYSGPLIDFPTYCFDSTQGIIEGLINFPISDSLIGIYGDGLWLSGAAGSGASTRLFGIYNLPYQRSPVMLSSINANGSVSLKYRDSVFVLAKGQEWKAITSRLDTIETAVTLFITTEKITNHGLQLKSKIQK